MTVSKLCFIGVIAAADPVRVEVPAAVQECVHVGIDVKAVTGDAFDTTREIARQVGLWDDSQDGENSIITGPDSTAPPDEELLVRVNELKIISRIYPMDRKRLVEVLQNNGYVVAVTGDDTSDAPVLRAAHVRLSTGDGTSVAREVSGITIIGSSFSSIGRAVAWRRSLYQNIQRFLLFQLTVNAAACLLVPHDTFVGAESPLTVAQMLWTSLIVDTFAAMAPASLPLSESVMEDKPHNRNAFILNSPVLCEITGVGSFFFALLLVLLYILQCTDATQLTDLLTMQLGTKGHISAYEQTLLFVISVMTHFFYLFDACVLETGRSVLHFKGCRGLLAIAAIIPTGQIVMVEASGLQQFFSVAGLKFIDWVTIVTASSLVLWVRELWHLLTKKKSWR